MHLRYFFALLVARAQRDFTLSQLSEVESVITYLKATINLYQQEGTLLTRMGIAAPGDEPVVLSASLMKRASGR